MHTFIKELEDLQCILHTLVFEPEPSIFTEEFALDLIETALHLMEEYMNKNPTIISEPDFHDILLEEIEDIFYIQMEEQILYSTDDSIEEDMNELLEVAFQMYVSIFCTERSFKQYENENENSFDKKDILAIETKINHLRNIPQPVQRTNEWYQFRHKLITASNAYKAFESQSTINQLIYEKCQPLKTEEIDFEIKVVNTNTTLHWGQKYEPLSVMFYENMYKTKVEDFGCIQHPTYSFIGASPDGIIVDPSSERYGRMLEIKNVVNREITGIPKKEYWIQMQLQMEVCDLDMCDFLETKFEEYADKNAYDQDFTSNKLKGIIMHFHTKEGKPYYEYKPLHIVEQDMSDKWEEDMIALHENGNEHIFMKTIYWKLEKWSCVLVQRNREWFKNNIKQLDNVWSIIEKERITGYDHRAPTKKVKRDQVKPFISLDTSNSSGCLLTLKKI
jgi:putative phage-type endonuclease